MAVMLRPCPLCGERFEHRPECGLTLVGDAQRNVEAHERAYHDAVAVRDAIILRCVEGGVPAASKLLAEATGLHRTGIDQIVRGARA